MDHKKSPIRRQKRQSKVLEDNFWDCSVCTYRNTAEAFKCLMCDVRKGQCFLSIFIIVTFRYCRCCCCIVC